jgi:2-polyprenyl-6-methoxyphenol hydroxylase-like FAD-dependent oxidoreductase
VSDPISVAIVGAGIAGLAVALGLRQRGINSRIYEVAPEVKELGVGITVLPHAMRELTMLGLGPATAAAGVENSASAFFNRFGQLIYKEPRGRDASYFYPEVGIHRGRLHAIMYEAALEQLGADAIVLNRRCVGLDQDPSGVTLHFEETTSGRPGEPARAHLVLACDGINSAVRRQLYPDEELAFEGINTWRGVARSRPILDGRTYIRIGSIRSAKIVIYPIRRADKSGLQEINWTVEMPMAGGEKNDWNKPGKLEDFIGSFEDWHFDWIDVPALLRASHVLLEYPMVDKAPIPRWTFGRVTFVGDAAHPMYQRGSNGAAQALIDARTIANFLRDTKDPLEALGKYESARRPATTRIVHTNRETPPDVINIKVEELTGDKPFDDLDRFISQNELRALSDNYKEIAGFARDDLR